MDSEFYRQLLDISRRMAETREVQPLLEYAMKQALDLLNAEQGYLVLVDEENRLDFRVRIARDGRQLADPESQISHSILTRVVRQREPVFLNDAILDPTFKVSDSVKQLQLRSVMAVPLRTVGDILGAIYVENRQRAHIFDERKLELLKFFASQAAVAIENALLNENLERKVQTRTAELRAAMNQAEQAWQHAVEANRLRTMVLSNVAHDLRSPVALAVTVLRTLREGTYGSFNDDQLRWINRALQSLDHAVNLTRDVFDLAKAEEAGRLEVYLKKTDLNDFLSEVISFGEGMSWLDDVRFHDDIVPDLPEIAIDETRIKQVLLNFLANAQKFTLHGRVTLYTIILPDHRGVKMGVRDTGSGIPLALQDKLFQRFQQLSLDTDKRRKGSGLGLAICKELVERHGGEIGVISTEEEGSDFFFTLPLNTTTTTTSIDGRVS